MDEALAAADFTTPASPGVSVFEAPLPGFDPDALSNPRSAEDTWSNPSGQTVHRKYVRGGSDDGTEQLQVWAFTT